MNVGQVLEVHLGFAAKKLGEQLAKLANEHAADAIKKKLALRLYSPRRVRGDRIRQG